MKDGQDVRMIGIATWHSPLNVVYYRSDLMRIANVFCLLRMINSERLHADV